jgi:hypothetical protein
MFGSPIAGVRVTRAAGGAALAALAWFGIPINAWYGGMLSQSRSGVSASQTCWEIRSPGEAIAPAFARGGGRSRALLKNCTWAHRKNGDFCLISSTLSFTYAPIFENFSINTNLL